MPIDPIDSAIPAGLAAISWSNPRKVPLAPGKILLYLIRVIDDAGIEYSYVGQTRLGAKGLQEYARSVKKIFAAKPRQAASGKGKYRAVHLALAKACEHGWAIAFYPLENVGSALLEKVEHKHLVELRCNLNAGRSWSVEDYRSLSIADLL